MFFVLSGFLIGTLILRERDSRGTFSLSAFYARRTLRIFPIYYALLALLAVRYLVFPNDRSHLFFSLLPWYALYLSNWLTIHVPGLLGTWSLASEEQFYLIWPACEKLLPRRAAIVVLVAAIAANQIVNLGLADDWFGGWIGAHRELLIIRSTFTPILLGVALAHCLHRRAIFTAAYRVLGLRWASPVLALALLAAFNTTQPEEGPSRAGVQALAAIFIASCVMREDHGLQRVLKWPPMRSIGVVSYGMYLLHPFLIGHSADALIKIGLKHPAFHFIGCTAATYVVAQASFRLYERPFLRIKERFQRRT